jgi:hypothetical protein
MLTRFVPGIRAVAFVGERILCSKKNRLFLTDRDLKAVAKSAVLPIRARRKLLQYCRLTERIFRVSIHAPIMSFWGDFLCIWEGQVVSMNLASGVVTREFALPSRRKALYLSNIVGVTGFENVVAFGEYWANPNNLSTSIWARGRNSSKWEIAHTFPNGEIEHIHNIVPDPYRNAVWILTGDFGNASALWRAYDNFNRVELFARGEQIHRAAWLHCLPDRLIYATDTQMERNSVCEVRFEDNETKITRRGPLPGSSIYYSPGKGEVVFSTVVEPPPPTGRFLADMLAVTRGAGIETDLAHIFSVTDSGIVSELFSAAKDRLPARLAQFGSFSFPAGVNPSRRIYAYCTALTGLDGGTLIIDRDR